jgi:hypothetical protein
MSAIFGQGSTGTDEVGVTAVETAGMVPGSLAQRSQICRIRIRCSY